MDFLPPEIGRCGLSAAAFMPPQRSFPPSLGSPTSAVLAAKQGLGALLGRALQGPPFSCPLAANPPVLAVERGE